MAEIKHLFKTPEELAKEILACASDYKGIVIVGLIKEDRQTELDCVTTLDASYMTNAEANWLLDRGKILLHNQEQEVINAN